MVQRKDESTRSSLSPTAFVGRVAPLAVLQRCLGEALEGRPRVVLVEGDAGVGKSRLVAEVLASARRRGAVVLVGHCREGLAVPYLPLASALEPLGDELGDGFHLVDPTDAAPSESVSAVDPRPAAPIVAACRAAVRAARRRPVVLLVEDLHWADPHTAELFEELVATALLAGSTSATAILVVATLRPASGHVATIVERLRRDNDVTWTRLVGMNELELNELLTSIGSARPSRALLSAFVEATDGNPLLARTLLGRLTDAGDVEVRGGELISTGAELLPLPGGLDDEVRRRLDRVGAACRSLLTKAAFVGDVGLLADLEAVAPADFDARLEEAEAATLLHDDGERYHFDHPLLRHVLYHDVGGRRRQRLHLELADELEDRHGIDGRRATEIADHLRRAGKGVDPARLARCCVAAGEQAFSVGAWGTAARFLDIAIAADPPTDSREQAQLALRAGIGHFRDHDLGGAETRLLEAIAHAKAAGDVDLWAVAALLVTRARMTIGPESVGAFIDTSLLDELLETAECDERRAGEIVGLLAEVRFHAFDFDGGLALLDEARQLANRNGDDDLATNIEFAAGLQHLGRLQLDAAMADFRSSAAHAERLVDPWKRVWGLGRLPLVEIVCGDLAAAVEHAAEATGVAASHHDWAEHALAASCTMQVAAARGHFAAAESAGAAAIQSYRRSDYSFIPPLVYPALAAVRSARGDAAGADEALDDWATVGGRSLAPYRLLVVASSLDPDVLATARPFRPVGDRPSNLFNLPVLCAQVEVATTLRDRALLTDAVEPLVALHRSGVRWCAGWPLLLARLLAGAARVLGRVDDAERWCAIAAAEAEASGAAGELARVTLERARAAALGGDDETAKELAAEAASSFDTLGMLPSARAAERLAGDRVAGERVIRTILFTDLVGSTEMNLRHGDVAYLELLDRHNSILRRRLRQFDGVELKHTGDGIGSWFSSAAAGCECALAIRDDLAEHNDSHPEAPLFVRFGLALGSPIPHEGDLYGVSMSLAARMCNHASPNEVLVSADVAHVAAGRRLTFRPLDPIALKGFPDPVPAFAVGRTE
jgi:class 3 adenylate cyclase